MLFAVLLLPALGAASPPPFAVSLELNQVEYGKPITLNLRTRYAHPSLDTVNLSALQPNFAIVTGDSVERDGQAQTWHIRLYARRVGRLQIPPLMFHGAMTRPLALSVSAPTDSRNRPIMVHSAIGATSVWVDQATPVTVRVIGASSFASLKTRSTQQNNLGIVALPATQTGATVNGQSWTQYRMEWLLYPQTAGMFTIQLPPVEYDEDGIVTHQFYVPPVNLHVRPLPVFVPPTMLVGRLDVSAVLPARPFIFRHELAFLTLHVRGHDPLGARWGILRQLKSDEAVTFYPAREDASSSVARPDRLEVPFRPTQIGWVTLPTIRLQYFDPETGKIVTDHQPLGRVLVLSPWIVAVAAALALWVLFIVSRQTYRTIERRFHAYAAYWKALRALEAADNASMLRSGLLGIARAESWPSNLTLSAWLRLWVDRYPHLASVAQDVNRLEAWLYGRAPLTADDIRPGLAAACYERLPALRLIAFLRGVHVGKR